MGLEPLSQPVQGDPVVADLVGDEQRGADHDEEETGQTAGDDVAQLVDDVLRVMGADNASGSEGQPAHRQPGADGTGQPPVPPHFCTGFQPGAHMKFSPSLVTHLPFSTRMGTTHRLVSCGGWPSMKVSGGMMPPSVVPRTL